MKLSKEEFESTRDFLKSYSKLYIETPVKKLGFLMDSHFYGRKDWIRYPTKKSIELEPTGIG